MNAALSWYKYWEGRDMGKDVYTCGILCIHVPCVCVCVCIYIHVHVRTYMTCIQVVNMVCVSL